MVIDTQAGPRTSDLGLRTVALHADTWFDGDRLHHRPVTVVCADGRIAAVHEGRVAVPGAEAATCGFLSPGLVEAHCHLFLDGAELDLAKRNAYQERPQDFAATGRVNLDRMRDAGITLTRDAGDRWGINHALRAENGLVGIRSAGRAIRRKGRYGSFMADEVTDAASATAAVRARTDVDDIKIVLTGIIDFAAAQVKGAPQFDLAELTAICDTARELGKPTFAHCSGRDGLELAVAAGVGSVEHGFFLDTALLGRMAERGVAWTPTWSPVAWVRDNPAALNLDERSVAGVAAILDNHRRCLAEAHRLGVRILAGSDAGSLGVVHGVALADEFQALADAGLPAAAILATATSAPRRAWGVAGGRIAVGEPADLAGFAAGPLAGWSHLQKASLVLTPRGLWRRPSTLAQAA
jgi:imidazolonepropionase-like amidohydrolase